MVESGIAYLAVLVGGGLVTAGLALYAVGQPRDPARAPFVGLMVTVSLWVWTYAAALTVEPEPARTVMFVVTNAPAGFLPVWWALFALGYAGRDEYVTHRTFALGAVVPALATVANATNASHHLMYSGFELHRAAGLTTVTYRPEPLFVVYLLYIFGLITAGVVVMIRVAFAYDSLYSEQALSIVLASVVPSIGAILWVAGASPIPGLRITPFTVPVAGVLYGNALFRHHLLDVGPATGRVGRDAAIEHLPDGVLVLDDDGRVADCNRAIERAFDCRRSDVVGKSVEAVVGDADLDMDGGSTRVELVGADGRRQFEVRTSPVESGRGEEMGHTLVLRDVTRRTLREQRLTVLNRVLRHNLRNDITLVNGYVEMLADRADDGQVAENVVSVTDDLLALSRKAQDIEDALGDDESRERVDVATLVDHVTSDLDPGESTVTVDVPAGCSVVTNRRILELVVGNLVENAVEHTDPGAVARLDAERTGDGVRITVTDDGPGIPEDELAAIQTGDETPLRHGSGLGLWIVAWGAEWLGGDVEFERDGGTTAVVRIPDLSDDSTDAVGVDADVGST